MPLYDLMCDNDQCQQRHQVVERYLRHPDSENPECELCHHPMIRLPSRVNIVFTGQFSARYNDKKRENAHAEGHWAMRVKSTTRPDKKPEPVWIDNFQTQKEFCKAEGLVNPKDLPASVRISKDGRSFESSSGMPGQWV